MVKSEHPFTVSFCSLAIDLSSATAKRAGMKVVRICVLGVKRTCVDVLYCNYLIILFIIKEKCTIILSVSSASNILYIIFIYTS